MINGAHSIIYSKDPQADREFLRGVLGLPSVDVGEGWLIFGLPPAEVAVHPGDENDVHELYLMCEDVETLVVALKERRVVCSPVLNRGWGLLTHVNLPGGGRLGIYEPRHSRPKAMKVGKPKPKAARRPPRKKARPRTKSKPKRR